MKPTEAQVPVIINMPDRLLCAGEASLDRFERITVRCLPDEKPARATCEGCPFADPIQTLSYDRSMPLDWVPGRVYYKIQPLSKVVELRS